MIVAQTQTAGRMTTVLTAGTHTFYADEPLDAGGDDKGPTPHELFDSSLAACKSLTAFWYAKRNGIPLEKVDVQIERDDSKEREGSYVLKVKIEFGGNLTDEQRTKLKNVVARCPLHKLMTQVKIAIETIP